MNLPFSQSHIEERAREDARVGVYDPDALIVSTLGPEPSFDPVDNFHHGTVGSRLQNPALEETQQDLRREEDELARHPSPHMLTSFVCLLLFVEACGAVYIMRALGIDNPERIVFGTALAICIFFATWLASRARNRLMSIAALLALCLLVTALTLVRVEENAGDDGSKAIDYAAGVIMLAITVGPALMAEHVLRLLAPALPVMRRILRLRTRLSRAQRQQKSATRFVSRVADRRQAWQSEAARRRAIYDRAYRAARAELGDASVSSQLQPTHDVNDQQTQLFPVQRRPQ